MGSLPALRRGLKVGALGWVAGLVGTVLAGTLVVGGFAGAVVASLPGAYAFYLNAHGLFAIGDLHTWNLAASADVLGIFDLLVLVALPVTVLLGCGAHLAAEAESRQTAVRAGASVTLGYGLLVLLTTLFLFAQASRLLATDGVAAALTNAGIVARLLVAGVLSPLVFGTLGGLVQWHFDVV